MGTATFAAAELFYFAPTLMLRGGGYLKTLSPDQLNTLVLLSLNLFGLGAGIFTVFYGMGWVLRGYLIFQSGYFPKFLGILMAIAGLSFIVQQPCPGTRAGIPDRLAPSVDGARSVVIGRLAAHQGR